MELVVAHVRSRPETQNIAACVGENCGLAHEVYQIGCPPCADRQKPPAPLSRDAHNVRNGRIHVQPVECSFQQRDLWSSTLPLGRDVA